MSQSTSSRQRRASQARKNARSGSSRPNRAQLRAAEVRAAESGAIAAAPAPVAATPAVRPGRNRPTTPVVGLSREAEMRYQRADLRRLLYTAAVLFVLMIALLFILD